MKWLKLWVPVALWAGVIFYFSSLPDLKTGLKYDFLLRKAAHITEYFILTFLLYRAFRGSFRMTPTSLLIYPAVFALLYAVSDEVHQYFVLGRNCSPADVLIDSLGIGCFFILLKFKPKLKPLLRR